MGSECIKTIRIFIPEEIPSYNKGEEAILKSTLKTLESLGDIDVCILSAYPERDRIYYSSKVRTIFVPNSGTPETVELGVRFYLPLLKFAFKHIIFMILYRVLGLKATSIMKDEIWKEYLESDVVIIGHDSALRFETIMLFVPFLKALKKTVIIYAGSIIKDFKGKLQETLAKFALNHVELLTLRESLSYNYLKNIGVQSPMFVTADLAFLMQAVPNEKAKVILTKAGSEIYKGPIVGISPSRIASQYIESAFGSFEDKYRMHVRILANIADYFIEELDATVVLIPHVFGPKDLNDLSMVADIYNATKNKSKILIIKDEISSSEIKGVIGLCDIFIGERLHSIIDSTSMYIPSVAVLEKSYRTIGILRDLLFRGKGFYDIRMLDFNSLIREVNYVWKYRQQIKMHLMDKTEIKKKKALLNGEIVKFFLLNKYREKSQENRISGRT